MPHYLAYTTEAYLALRLSHWKRDEVLDGLADRHGDIGYEQHAVRAHIASLGDSRFGGGTRPDQFHRKLQIESDSFALVRHVNSNLVNQGF